MPSFDIVSEFDKHELTNAVDQAEREVTTRFDFKDSDAKFELEELEIKMTAQTEFQLQQMRDILEGKVVKRGIDLATMKYEDPVPSGKIVFQKIKMQEGIEQETAKKIIKHIKDNKFKVQAAIQGEKIRVTGKKRDDLQEVIGKLKAQKFGLPLQFNNFRE